MTSVPLHSAESQHTDDLTPRLWAAMETVLDPELALNVVELGMVRGIDSTADGDVTVHLALTSLTCPVWDIFIAQIEVALGDLARTTKVEFVVRPAWTPAWMDESARAMLIAIGYLPPQGTFEKLDYERVRAADPGPRGGR